MRATEIQAGDKCYKLRFTFNSMCELEGKLGKPVHKAFEDSDSIGLSVVRDILWAGLITCQSGITPSKAGDIVDEYLSNGGSIDELAGILTNALEGAGFFQQGKTAAFVNGKSR